jgi:hypothetical protein
MPEDRLATVAKSLGMSRTPESMEALRRDIRTELSDLHPDRNGTEATSPVPNFGSATLSSRTP